MSETLQQFTHRTIDACASAFGVTSGDILSRSRTYNVALARQVAMWIVTKHRDEQGYKLGEHFNRDRSTVAYAVRMVKSYREINPKVRERVNNILFNMNLL